MGEKLTAERSAQSEGDIAMLKGKAIVLVEDEALIAMDLVDEMERAGARVVAECATVDEALGAIETVQFDAAVLDVDLRGRDVFPVADRLIELGKPFLFHTGHATRYDLEGRYPDWPVCAKPVAGEALLRVLAGQVG